MKKADKDYLSRVANLGCIVCRNLGFGIAPAEYVAIHHIRDGQGMSQKAPHTETLPLCAAHHQNGGRGVALHAGQKTWERLYGTERELLEQVRELLNGYA